MITNAELDEKLAAMELEFTQLVAELIPDIDDDYRVSDDDGEDSEPGMSLTVAVDDDCETWSYQTGDNSFTGGAYGLPHWAVVGVYRDSDPADVAREIVNELGEAIAGADLIRDEVQS